MTTEQLISLPVYSIYDQNIVGIVTNVYIYRKRVTALLVIDETNYDKYVLFTKDIYSAGTQVVLITNSTKLYLYQSIEYKLSKYTTPLTKPLITLEGSLFDSVTNIEFDEHFALKNVYYGNTKIDANNITILDKSCVVRHNFHKHNFAPQKHFPKLQNVKSVQVEIQQQIQNKSFSSISSLVGKHTTKNILSQNGEILVKKNSKITSGIIAKLSTLGKLNELELNVK